MLGNFVKASALFFVHALMMTMKLCTRLTLAGILALSLSFAPNRLTAADAARAAKPNFIVILTDDQGWTDLNCQGIRKDLRTPNLDALAAGGLRATSGYVTAPQCVPSRGGLNTGRYQTRFGLEANTYKLDGFDQQVTIAMRLKKAGYATGMTGKWHLGPDEKITTHGYDDVFCTQSSIGMRLNGWANFTLDGKTVPGAAVRQEGKYHLEVNAAAACAFIKRHQAQPFFFYLAFRAPHTPLDAPPKYVARFPGQMPERRRMALAAISAIDDGVGQIMQTLRQTGLEEKTLVFFLADNGAPLKIHKTDSPLNTDAGGWDGSLNEPLNGEKGMLSEGGIREPWIAYWKGVIPAGQTYAQPVISLDIGATAVALAGLPHDAALDGVNLLPFFTGENKAAPHDALYWRWIAQSAIREGKWKLLIGGARSYLFDLDADPEEKHNLITSNPDMAQHLRARLEAWGKQLQPPGLCIEPMSRNWEDYYDYYLDGKTVKPTPAAKGGVDTIQGWLARGGQLELKNGALHVTPEKDGKQHPFIACSKLEIPGPVQATIRLRAPAGGSAGFCWRLDGDKDFLPQSKVSQPLATSPDWQEVKMEIPAKAKIIHLRTTLPNGEIDISRIDLANSTGKILKRWNFAGKE